MTYSRHHAEVQLYAAAEDCSIEYALYKLPLHITESQMASRLLSCHRDIMAKEVAPLLKALKYVARFDVSMDTRKMAQSTIAAWEKNHAIPS